MWLSFEIVVKAKVSVTNRPTCVLLRVTQQLPDQYCDDLPDQTVKTTVGHSRFLTLKPGIFAYFFVVLNVNICVKCK